MIKSETGEDLFLDYEFNCILERHITDYFKFMYQGNLTLDILDKDSKFRIASGQVSLIHSLR